MPWWKLSLRPRKRKRTNNRTGFGTADAHRNVESAKRRRVNRVLVQLIMSEVFKPDLNGFRPFGPELKDILRNFVGDDYVGSDYSYYAFLLWFDRGEYLLCDDVLYLRAELDDGWYYWPPLVKKGSALTVAQAALALPDDASFAFCTEQFVNDMYGGYYVYSHRDWAEYIYSVSDFVELPGKRYHAKRNHIAKFLKNNVPVMSAITENDIDDVRAFERAWLAARDFDGKAEESANKEKSIVKCWIAAALSGDLVCDVLRIDGKLAGIAIGEILPSGNAVEMYEKADVAYEGIYSYLAREFAARNFADCKYLNRQEDMGLEGLRKSKLSYNPEFLLDKYILKPAKHVSDCYAERVGKFFSKEVKKQKLPPEKYVLTRLREEDFDEVYGFLERERGELKNKLFFLNYTEEELRGVLKNGYMAGARCDGELIATCAVDPDEEYGRKLAEICGEKDGRRYCEFSGIMTARKFRGMGVSSAVCRAVKEYAEINLSPCVLCAVVQFDNAPSLNNLAKMGFEPKVTRPYGEYTFTYLTLEV